MPVAKEEKEGKREEERKKKKKKARRLVVGYTVLNTTRREIYRKRVTSVRSISVVRTKSPLISRTNRRLCAAVLHLDARISPPLLRNARQVYRTCTKYRTSVARYASLYRDKTRPRKTGRSINTPASVYGKE